MKNKSITRLKLLFAVIALLLTATLNVSAQNARTAKSGTNVTTNEPVRKVDNTGINNAVSKNDYVKAQKQQHAQEQSKKGAGAESPAPVVNVAAVSIPATVARPSGLGGGNPDKVNKNENKNNK